jgi:Uma2 family endonuclease
MSEVGTRYSVETGRSGLTYEDFCALPDDGLRYEVVDGLLFAEPSPRRAHQEAVGNLFAILHAHVRAHDLGKVYVAPFDVILDPKTTVEPDLVFVVKDRLDIVAERGVEAAPDLLVEVLSPGTARRDRVRKLNAYARHGVRHYWLVDPEAKTLEAFELVEGAYRLAAAVGGDDEFRPRVFPGLAISLPILFA